MEYTRHAKERAQERGIPQAVIDLVLKYGTVDTNGSGADEVTLHPRDRKAARRQLRQKLQLLEKASDVVVITDGDRAITTYRQFQ